MAEDDVERLVAVMARREEPESHRLARIVRELLAFLPTGPCIYATSERPDRCQRYAKDPDEQWRVCQPCRARALRERLNRLARGEEA